MAGSLLPQPKQIFQNDAWGPLSGGKIFTYEPGTLTPKATYSDYALVTANTNPVVANARGEVLMYGTGLYRIILKDASDVTIYDVDNVGTPSAAADAFAALLAASSGSSLVGFIQAGYGSSERTVEAKLRESVSVTDKGATVLSIAADNDTAFTAAAALSSYVYVPDGDFPVTTASLTHASKLFGPGNIVMGGSTLPVGDIKASTTLPVPSVFADINAALDYLNNKSISPDAEVTIEVAAGTHDYTASIAVNHPDGDRIRLVGAGKATCTLRIVAGFPAATSFITLEGGERLGYINGFTLDGNARLGYTDSASDAQAVLLRRDCYVKLGADIIIKDWARCGILAYQGSTVLLEGDASDYVTIQGCGSDGIVSSAGSNVYARYVLSQNNLGFGIYADQDAYIDARDAQVLNNVGTAGSPLRGGGGIIALYGSTIRASNAVITGNAATGLYAYNGSTIFATGATVNGNGIDATAATRNGILGVYGSTLYLDDTTADNNAASGLKLESGSSAYAERLNVRGNGASVASSAGLYVTEGGSFTGGGLTSTGNTGRGVFADRGASVVAPTAVISSNTSDGVNAQQAAVWLSNTPGTATTIQNNGGWGILARISATVQITGTTVATTITGNTSGAVSPAVNTSGVSNSYIHN